MNIHDIITEALKLGASDIFLIAGSPTEIKVRNQLMRLNDTKLTPSMTETLITEIYHFAHRTVRDVNDQDGDDDFSFSVQSLARFRVNVYRQRGSLAAVLRIVRFSIPKPEDLHIPPAIVDFAGVRKGLVIISGPAGSGKSSTVATIIDRINQTRAAHIVTIEDPIEYLHAHARSVVSQREIGTDCANTASALKAALRQAPDVLFVGEMRDLDTIALAITAAETGHLVFSTLHTLGAANTIDRIIDVFPAAQQQQIRVQLSMVLQAVISQQLINDKEGRLLPVFEVMTNTPAVRNLIREGKTHQLNNAITASVNEGMTAMDGMLEKLVKERVISSHEALNHAFDPVILRKRLDEV
jgi:twitching motility protein PilT